MGFKEASEFLKARGFGDRIQEFDVSSATVELAATAVGCEPARIAKSLTFHCEDSAVMILCAGDAKVNNSKFKMFFRTKAKMLSPQEVHEKIGHDIGGVCPFGIKEGVSVYLDESLRRFDYVYPACGSGNSAVKVNLSELFDLSGAREWIDVCKVPEKVLYINACVREESRTDRIARALLGSIGPYQEVRLAEENLQPLDEARLKKRNTLIEAGDYADPWFDYARQFAAADQIVISAPYWDLSFPALLKLYIENIYVGGIVSEYASDGTPHGLCAAKKLYYVTTAGGPYDPRFSYDQIREIATTYFGISETELIAAEMLDVWGYDPEKIVQDCLREYHLNEQR